MIIKSLALLCFIAIAHSASIQQRNIPVEVLYEEEVQVAPKQLQNADEEIVKEELDAVKNLDAKVQLSPEELSQSLKHLPQQQLQENPEKNQGEKGGNPAEKLGETPELIKTEDKAEEKPQEQPEEIPLQNLKFAQPEETPQREPEVLKSGGSESSLESRLQYLRDYIFTELKNLRNGLKPSKDQIPIEDQQWEDLEKSVDQVYEEEKRKILLKQSSGAAQPQEPAQGGNIFQNFINGISGAMSNFVQNIQNQSPPGTQGDTGTDGQPSNPGGFQGFVGQVQQGFTNVINSISSFGQSQGGTATNTVLGDTGVSGGTQPPASGNPVAAFVGGVVSTVQNVFGGNSGSVGAPGTQADTSVNAPATSSQQGPGAGFVQAIGNTINAIFQGARPPGTSGDEGSTTGSGSGGNILANIGNAIQNSPLNIFRPQNGGAAGQNPIQTGLQSAGNQIQQVVSNIQVPTLGSANPEGSQPVVENPDGERKPIAENTIENDKPEKPEPVKEDNEVVKKEEQKKEILTTAQ